MLLIVGIAVQGKNVGNGFSRCCIHSSYGHSVSCRDLRQKSCFSSELSVSCFKLFIFYICYLQKRSQCFDRKLQSMCQMTRLELARACGCTTVPFPGGSYDSKAVFSGLSLTFQIDIIILSESGPNAVSVLTQTGFSL